MTGPFIGGAVLGYAVGEVVLRAGGRKRGRLMNIAGDRRCSECDLAESRGWRSSRRRDGWVSSGFSIRLDPRRASRLWRWPSSAPSARNPLPLRNPGCRSRQRSYSALQELKLRIDTLLRERAALDDGSALKQAFETAETSWRRRRSASISTTRTRSTRDLASDSEEKHAAVAPGTLRGEGHEPQRISSMEQEIEMFGRQRGRLDERILVLMEEIETTTAEAERLTRERDAARQAWEEQVANYKRDLSRINAGAETTHARAGGAGGRSGKPYLPALRGHPPSRSQPGGGADRGRSLRRLPHFRSHGDSPPRRSGRPLPLLRELRAVPAVSRGAHQRAPQRAWGRAQRVDSSDGSDRRQPLCARRATLWLRRLPRGPLSRYSLAQTRVRGSIRALRARAGLPSSTRAISAYHPQAGQRAADWADFPLFDRMRDALQHNLRDAPPLRAGLAINQRFDAVAGPTAPRSARERPALPERAGQ